MTDALWPLSRASKVGRVKSYERALREVTFGGPSCATRLLTMSRDLCIDDWQDVDVWTSKSATVSCCYDPNTLNMCPACYSFKRTILVPVSSILFLSLRKCRYLFPTKSLYWLTKSKWSIEDNNSSLSNLCLLLFRIQRLQPASESLFFFLRQPFRHID